MAQFSPPSFTPYRFIPYPNPPHPKPTFISISSSSSKSWWLFRYAGAAFTAAKFRGNSLYQKKTQQIFWDQPDHSPVWKRTEIAMEKNHHCLTQQLKNIDTTTEIPVCHSPPRILRRKVGELFVVVLKMFATKKSHQDDVTILACHTSRLPDCKTSHLVHSYTPEIWKMAIFQRLHTTTLPKTNK